MELAARQILRALRGKRSQVAFARRLGYRGNPIASWEAGRRAPNVLEVFRICGVIGVDLRPAMYSLDPRARDAWKRSGRSAVEQRLVRWLQELKGRQSVQEIAEKAGCSRFSVSRWLSGQCQIRFPEFLNLVDAMTSRVTDWVAALVAIDAVPALQARHELIRLARDVAYQQPWTEVILRLLETETYAQAEGLPEGWFAQRLGLPIEIEKEALALLERAAIIRWDGKRYCAIGSLTVDTRSRPEGARMLRNHWARVAAEGLETPTPRDLASYNLLSCSRADLQRIRELQLQFYEQIRAIVAASEPVETTALVYLRLREWDPA